MNARLRGEDSFTAPASGPWAQPSRMESAGREPVKLQDKVVVVTGSGNGVGEAVARRFSAEGARVVVTDIEADRVEQVAGEIGSVGLAVDITVEDNVKAVADLARRTYGEIDVWYSNAGFAGPREPGKVQANELWESGWNLHVMSYVYAAREVLPAMLERGDGYLLQTASSVALSAQVEKATYSVTKHAALALAEWLAITYRPKGVKVSCFCPGAMLTRMLLSNDLPPDHPALARALRREQVAELVVRGIDAERFLIVEDEDAVATLAARAADYDGWLNQMGSVSL
jgi:NAD(P)-dependent dehydrogenase (short-subunit alcohol dehydrogenase family)